MLTRPPHTLTSAPLSARPNGPLSLPMQDTLCLVGAGVCVPAHTPYPMHPWLSQVDRVQWLARVGSDLQGPCSSQPPPAPPTSHPSPCLGSPLGRAFAAAVPRATACYNAAPAPASLPATRCTCLPPHCPLYQPPSQPPAPASLPAGPCIRLCCQENCFSRSAGLTDMCYEVHAPGPDHAASPAPTLRRVGSMPCDPRVCSWVWQSQVVAIPGCGNPRVWWGACTLHGSCAAV